MKTNTVLLFAIVGLFTASVGSAATKDYQVTGPVLEVTESMIAVQKGKDRWEIARTSSTKADSEIKVGDKVTIHYTMSATKIENKGGGKAEEKSSPAKK